MPSAKGERLPQGFRLLVVTILENRYIMEECDVVAFSKVSVAAYKCICVETSALVI